MPDPAPPPNIPAVGGQFAPVATTTYMERVSRLLEERGPLALSPIVKSPGVGEKRRVEHALRQLIDHGYAEAERAPEPKRHLLYRATRSFREATAEVGYIPPPEPPAKKRPLDPNRADVRKALARMEGARLEQINEVKREQLLVALRVGLSLTRAAAEIPVSRDTIVRWMQADRHFAVQVSDAMEEGNDFLEDEARRRAIEGVAKPIMFQGKVVRWVREYDTPLLILLLKARRPERFRERKGWWADDEPQKAARVPTSAELEEIRKRGVDQRLAGALDRLAEEIGERERAERDATE